MGAPPSYPPQAVGGGQFPIRPGMTLARLPVVAEPSWCSTSVRGSTITAAVPPLVLPRSQYHLWY
eukprot:3307348-Rhodomonas_salina.2